ncbi:hypothetical protein LY90DRAFT_192277 [Neocallimastix californiae]|uniref:Uncharacterized protein n=1 Tax=Neocallimastix californiae TaxID=1754190 RepID=A0A1Y1ZLQ9_9FUNG|nr:hypothetical protein LY90DRAFT_192277 [Neocallimastix californiae]|eukprot:ORY11178.1 hypothetical protein LY90DRAFT_192277 [Neocallimastix californiae]
MFILASGTNSSYSDPSFIKKCVVLMITTLYASPYSNFCLSLDLILSSLPFTGGYHLFFFFFFLSELFCLVRLSSTKNLFLSPRQLSLFFLPLALMSLGGYSQVFIIPSRAMMAIFLLRLYFRIFLKQSSL